MKSSYAGKFNTILRAVLAELQKLNFLCQKILDPGTPYLGNTSFGCKRNKVTAL
jgi:hypothetical protein